MPNILFVHYADLKTDPEGEIRRIAKFVDVDVESNDEELLKKVLEYSSFNYMKEHSAQHAPLGGSIFNDTFNFINKGVTGRHKEHLTPEDIARAEVLAKRELGDDLAAWALQGRLALPEENTFRKLIEKNQ